MTDISSIGMVSYYNPLAMYRQQQQSAGQQSLVQQVQQHSQAQQAQQHAATTPLDGGQQYWYGYPHGHPHAAHHHQPAGPQQYLDHAEVLPGWPHPHAHHYSHLQYQHQAYQHQQQPQPPPITGVTDWSSDDGNTAVGTGEPSPITVSGSEISNPGTPSTPPANNNNTITTNNNNTTPMRPTQMRSPYEWMKKTSYQSQPNPGKTRTKDKYRVVYTDHQRLELEKEFHYSRYITIRRKAELANTLALSERQVKIWFQNRRAKDRKQVKKREELEQKDSKSMDGVPSGAMAALTLGGMGGMLGGLMHNGSSPPLTLGHPAHTLTLGHAPTSLHPHAHQHAHPHTVLGL
ncbi:PREDICTED: homeobox protein CHOX-CAD-like [Dufourea novaeangliae]|uniref:Homeotic protein caudal n=1 Tax=Dufourea novaeangliae TaxID=178035 RepID=A0A154PQS3_DUFNO|nr:PREDICTED: homeobox protein CHOX-CAD-like [Dufourea novaeangliae]KZC14259.1 Homeotic protein caudal [Dufourea novaeangliae]